MAKGSFAGIVFFDDAPLSRRIEEILRVSASGSRGAPSTFVSKTKHALFIAPEPAAGTNLFAAAGRLESERRAADSDQLEIQQSFERRGDEGIADLRGAFSFAHWDEGTGTLTLARDVLGRRGLFYHRGSGFVAFASNLAVLLRFPDVPRELDERMLANFLALNHREHNATIYRGISRVPSRSVVRLTRGGTHTSQYWTPDLRAVAPHESAGNCIERARELLDKATARSLRGASRVAVHLSGGLDSSAVAASILRHGGVECVGYTGLPPSDLGRPPRKGWYLDERTKVEALGRLYPALHSVFVTPRGAHLRVRDPERNFLDVPLPHRGVANLGWFGAIDDRIKADGHDLIFHGGLGNIATGWTGQLSLAALLAQGKPMSVLREARAISRCTGDALPRVLAREAVLPLLPLPAYRTIGRMLGPSSDDISAMSLLRPDVVQDLDLAEQWHADGFDAAYRLRGASSAAFRTFMLFDNNQVGRDIGCGREDAEGIEYRSPFDDRDLLEFCVAVPETMFRRDGIPRWFARQVFSDRLPSEILSEQTSGEQAPNWFESLDARKPAIVATVECLEASSLASRLIDLPRLKRLLSEWPQDARSAEARAYEYRYALDRAVHMGLFIRWVEGGNG